MESFKSVVRSTGRKRVAFEGPSMSPELSCKDETAGKKREATDELGDD